MSTVSSEVTHFTLPPRHLEVQAKAQEIASRFALRHREVRLYPFEHGRLHPELWDDPDAQGIERTELPMRWREGARRFQLVFNEVEAPLEGLVGEEGQGLLTLWPFTTIERLITAALCVGNARYCVDRSVARAGGRTIFGKLPIGAEQSIQHPIALLHGPARRSTRLCARATTAGHRTRPSTIRSTNQLPAQQGRCPTTGSLAFTSNASLRFIASLS